MVRQFRTVEEANEFIEAQDIIINELNQDVAELNAQLENLEEKCLDQVEYIEELEDDLQQAELQMTDTQDYIDELEDDLE